MLIVRKNFNYHLGFAFLISSTYVFLLVDVVETIQKIILLILLALASFFWGFSKSRIYLWISFSAIVFISSIGAFFYGVHIDILNLVRAYVSFSMVFLFFALQIPKTHINSILDSIISLPFMSLIIGFIGILWGWFPWVFEYGTGAFRLRGGVIAAHLAMLSVVSIYAILYKLNSSNNRKYYILLFLSASVVVLTATRGALIAIIIAMIPFVLKLLSRLSLIKLLSLSSALSLIGAYSYYIVSVRSAQTMDSEDFNASGRLVAWNFFYEKIMEYPYWGRGLGAVTSLTAGEVENNLSLFLVPHNEYIRFSVDLGVLGALLFFTSIILYLFLMCKTAGSNKFIYLFILFSFFTYALVDNLFSTFQFAIPFFLIVNIILMKK